MSDVNVVILSGRLTRDCDVRYTSGNTAVGSFGLACNRVYKRNGEYVDDTTFVDITMFGQVVDNLSKYLTKGSAVTVEGRLKLDSWEKDGTRHSRLTVIANQVHLGPKNKTSKPKQEEAVAVAADAAADSDNEDIPF